MRTNFPSPNRPIFPTFFISLYYVSWSNATDPPLQLCNYQPTSQQTEITLISLPLPNKLPLHPCSYRPTSQRKELSRWLAICRHRSFLHTPAATGQFLCARSYLPSWPYATDPSFRPLQLPANFSAQRAISQLAICHKSSLSDLCSYRGGMYLCLLKLTPKTKHFSFYLYPTFGK